MLVDRSRTRIRALGFFKDVTIKNSPGSRPDKTDITVTVTEQSTGEVSLGAGYSSTSSFVGEFSYTERNLFGRGQYLARQHRTVDDQQAVPVQLHRAVVPRSAAGRRFRSLQDG